MSYGPSQTEKSATSNQQRLAGTAEGNSSNLFSGGNTALQSGQNLMGTGQSTINAGAGLLNTGGGNVNSGTNYLNTILHGNQANTSSLLAPDINRIRSANQSQLQSLSTLMPRGGGRSGALFNAAYAPNAQINGLFNGTRTAAATALPQIGLQQQGVGLGQQQVGLGQQNVGLGQQQVGSSLFGLGNQSLGLGQTGNQDVYNNAFQGRQYSNSMWGQLGGGLFNLATAPLGGTMLGKIPGLGG